MGPGSRTARIWGRGGVLHYPQGIPSILLAEVVPEPVPSTGRPWETWEGALALGCFLQKSDIEPVGQVFCLTDQQPVQVDVWLRPMHPPP